MRKSFFSPKAKLQLPEDIWQFVRNFNGVALMNTGAYGILNDNILPSKKKPQ